jgi:hypothetical protein
MDEAPVPGQRNDQDHQGNDQHPGGLNGVD